MDDFYRMVHNTNWEELNNQIKNCSEAEVLAALSQERLHPQQFLALISPAAREHLETLAQKAHEITKKRFGRTILLYAPLYLSNYCTNSCVYCGFNCKNQVKRCTLSIDEAFEEAYYLHQKGFRHILLVSGEAPQEAPLSYLCEVVQRLRPLFASISIEIYPLETEGYQRLCAAGVDGLVIYQETYEPQTYALVHPAGRKRNFDWRLQTPQRGGEAGIRRIGIGALLGLANWRIETYLQGLHAWYLMKHYWKSHISVSFPRLRPAAGGYTPSCVVTDEHLVQILCALRLFLPDVGLVISTRERPEFRDNLIPLGVTQMSAGSRTMPGGYRGNAEAEGQFEVSDDREPHEIEELIRRKGYDPVWKDWDHGFLLQGETL